jgi:hypothetical protein
MIAGTELIPHDSTPKKEAFLAAYAECGNVSYAAQVAGCSRFAHYKWQDDPEYQKRFEEAHAQAFAILEMEARRRAVEGTRRVIFHKGVPIGEELVYSDNLLMFLMKGAEPEKYRDNHSMEVSGQIMQIDWGALACLSEKKTIEVQAEPPAESNGEKT